MHIAARVVGLSVGALMLLGLTGCAGPTSVSAKGACRLWLNAISHSDSLAEAIDDGITAAAVKKQAARWQGMVEAAKDIGPRVRAADPLFSGYFSKFASRGDTALELAAKVESGDSDLVPDLDDARKKLLDSFYPVSQVCFDQLTGK